MVNKPNNKELHIIQNIKNKSKLLHRNYESVFETKLDWKSTCIMPRIVAIATTTRMFQYESLSNNSYLNKLLSILKKFHPPYVFFVH